MKRQNISSGAKWEKIVGYSRAVKIGPHVWVSGTVAFDENGGIVGEGDSGKQAAQIFVNIEKALTEAGARMHDVVRTRIFAVDIERDWEKIGEVHEKVFHTGYPATSMVQVAKLIDPRFLVEIEVDAYIGESSTGSDARYNDYFES